LAYDPNGVNCGYYVVTTPGEWGLMHVYGDDPSTSGVDEGATGGDTIYFTVNGYPAQASPVLSWADKVLQQIELAAVSSVVDRDIELATGWNLISFDIDPLRDGRPVSLVADVLEPIDGYYDAVLGYGGGGRSYYPQLPPAFNDLIELDYEHGYWIRMNADNTLSMSGSPIAADHAIPLQLGWNLVSYLPDMDITVSDVLASIAGQYDAVLGYDGGGQSYYPQLLPQFNDLKCLAVNQGYWIKATEATTLVYPTSGTCVGVTMAEGSLTGASGVTPTNVWCDVYSLDTRVGGEPVPAGSIISAFDPDGVLCGIARVQSPGQWGIMHVYGDDPDTDVDEGAVAGDELRFTVNGAHGHPYGQVIWRDKALLELALSVEPPIQSDEIFLPMIER